MICAGILAGGIGSRMGADLPKQFLEICGRTILARTVERFVRFSPDDEHHRIDLIIIAAPQEHIQRTRDIISREFPDDSRISVTCGGTDRNDSIIKVIEQAKRLGADDSSLLLTHDAARPFVPTSCIGENISTALTLGVADTAIPVTDTMLRSADGETVADIPDRRGFFNTQTPQTFRIGWFLGDYAALGAEERGRITDACGVFMRAGRKIYIVNGAPENIKITTPFDIRLAEAIAEREM